MSNPSGGDNDNREQRQKERVGDELEDIGENEWERAKYPKPIHLLHKTKEEEGIRVFATNSAVLLTETDKQQIEKAQQKGKKPVKEDKNEWIKRDMDVSNWWPPGEQQQQMLPQTDADYIGKVIAESIRPLLQNRTNKNLRIECRIFPNAASPTKKVPSSQANDVPSSSSTSPAADVPQQPPMPSPPAKKSRPPLKPPSFVTNAAQKQKQQDKDAKKE